MYVYKLKYSKELQYVALQQKKEENDRISMYVDYFPNSFRKPLDYGISDSNTCAEKKSFTTLQ